MNKSPEKLWEELVHWDLSSIGGACHTQRSVTWCEALQTFVLKSRQAYFQTKGLFFESWFIRNWCFSLTTCLWRTSATLSEGLAPFPVLDFAGWKHQTNQRKIKSGVWKLTKSEICENHSGDFLWYSELTATMVLRLMRWMSQGKSLATGLYVFIRLLPL